MPGLSDMNPYRRAHAFCGAAGRIFTSVGPMLGRTGGHRPLQLFRVASGRPEGLLQPERREFPGRLLASPCPHFVERCSTLLPSSPMWRSRRREAASSRSPARNASAAMGWNRPGESLTMFPSALEVAMPPAWRWPNPPGGTPIPIDDQVRDLMNLGELEWQPKIPA
jgi:hypothetical protein